MFSLQINIVIIPAFAFEDTSIGFKLQIVTAGKSDIVSCNFIKPVIVPYWRKRITESIVAKNFLIYLLKQCFKLK